jgi:hypothetical protein
MTMHMRAGLIAACGLVLTAGCYTYKPVAAPQVGMDIRARLKTDAAVRRSQGLEEAIMRLDGKVVQLDNEAISLDVLVARSNSAFQNIEMRDTVRVQTNEIDAIMVRQFSPVRTAVFTAGTLAGAYAVILGIEQVVGGTGDDPDPGQQTFRAVFSWQTLRTLLGAWR